jgi:Spy/CpxP family protein refolding chaperone
MKRMFVFLMAAILILSVSAFAQRGHRGMQGMHGDGPGMCGSEKDGFRPQMILHLADEIGLDENQVDKIGDMLESFANERIDHQAELKKAQIKLKHLRMDEASETEIISMIEKVGELRTEMQVMKFQHRRAIKDILTDKQLEKFRELVKERRFERGFGEGCKRFNNMRSGAPGVPGKPDVPRSPGSGFGRW